MVVEIAGARVMAPAFGLSAVPWTAVIGVILAALAAGNWFGGRWADRGRPGVGLLLASAGATAVLPAVGSGLPFWAVQRLGFIPGALTTAAVLFAPSVFFLGAVTPALVRADTAAVTSVGRRAGDVGAAATLGSIAGTFVTGFVLLPLFPLPLLLGLTAAGFVALAGLTVAVLGRGPTRELLAGIAAAAVALSTVGGWETPGLLHREETLYGSVRVTEREWRDGRTVRELWQNGGSSSAEDVATGSPAHPYATAVGLLIEPVIERVDSVLVLGGGALSLPVTLACRRAELTLDVVELDPAVTRLARDYFVYGRRPDWPGIRVTHEDARLFLRRAEGRYDVILVDVFDHLVTVPWTMVAVEALAAMRERLAPGGMVVVNVLTPLDEGRAAFFRRLLATTEAVFPAVRAYLVTVDAPPEVTRNVLLVAAASEDALPPVDWKQAERGPEGSPLTDAHAPVEYLQSKIFWEGLRWP